MGKIRSSERIRRVDGYGDDAYTYYPIVIIGAGESGLAMGCRLKAKLGFDQFRIFDRQSGVGGTWWINRYPGVACDIPAPLYSFSFDPFLTMTSLYPDGADIAKYLQGVCANAGIYDKIELNSEVNELKWNEKEKLWESEVIHLAHGVGDWANKKRNDYAAKNGIQSVIIGREKIKAKIVISCCGGLREPSEWPDNIPGKDKFKGPIVHTARWDDSIDFKDKEVVIVGTGCSAAQVAPRITKAPYFARSVTQLMRTAPWVVPKTKEPLGAENWKKNGPWLFTNFPFIMKIIRFAVFYFAEEAWFRLFLNKDKHIKGRAKEEQHLLKWMRSKTPAKYHKMLTPDFGVGCKRRIFDKEWYVGMNDPKYQLTTQKLIALNEDSVTLAAGGEFPGNPDSGKELRVKADVIVQANGFDASGWLHPLKVVGKRNIDLFDRWTERGGAQMYMGMAMDDFPNFFAIFGPNTATGHSSVILASENMVEMALKFVEPLLTGDCSEVEVRKDAEIEWTSNIQKELKDTVFMSGGCASWYYDPTTKWNSTVYPRSQIDFMYRCLFPTYSHWIFTYTPAGYRKHILAQISKVLGVVFVAFVGLWMRRTNRSFVDLKDEITMGGKVAAYAALGYAVKYAKQAQQKIYG